MHGDDGDTGADGNNNSCTRDSTSFTGHDCRPSHPREERFRGDLRTTDKEINNYKASPGLLRQHIATHGTAQHGTARHGTARHGTAPDGRLFRTNRNGLPEETCYGEVWAQARKDVPSETETASLLARRPYDLRHADVSFWLSSGVDAMECAQHAGFSTALLHKVYAKVLDQTREHANSRIDAALREGNEPE
ncbi:hypothetical protein [Streptomyces sp. NPDC050263]|uniref:hypothetical protein n=1 Tax=Streptomyces sp. NPDC050263 TaxID=3155037 RepID=UPI00343EB379